ncbi:MAG: hypothetical protein AUJ32_00020 [Parcubacteria group bacterium CG1_02_40_82]|uniref:Uncharacterized protein n=4 Tax=Candidatus Portnoyibacteriota TaxID=1817913 RepID=A0A2M7IJE4_9BACT|nr:MAG: hypothetical protein AUJ32_00020 [Parcubacteria group bacterium CG1_02_40_82]PIQ75147.1 MAG: hypothetical protein COV84_02805 [Candidatus Portnoybacteria bacterium CG11_big_fil_rev_8_21_14_0_20_40_15]PIS30950.1 MAG: hypothetical protein COT41_02720 [Candidatus Portnoybacteria bacterium CG08_land_8_20_14_0_20_40_83]PIW76625.1 MAG: hypothetical protein CO001_00325 [Candidatus Portnoybacteria bacterium CG_4_8_14_3_um_filter_40_10]PIY75048.1 MAG: hypothetical protein COY85_01450 [Candidatus
MKKLIIILIIIIIAKILMAFLLPKVIPGAKASFFSQYSIDEKCYGFTFGTHCFGVIKSPVIK